MAGGGKKIQSITLTKRFVIIINYIINIITINYIYYIYNYIIIIINTEETETGKIKQI